MKGFTFGACNFFKIWTTSYVFFKDFFYFSKIPILWNISKWHLCDFTSMINRALQWHLHRFCTTETTINVFAGILITLYNGSSPYLLTYRVLLLLNHYSNFLWNIEKKYYQRFIISRCPIPESWTAIETL